MLLDQVTPEQMRAGQVLTGLTMVGFLGARFFGRNAHRFRVGIAIAYIVGILAFAAYNLY